jgi:hypothetical protein
MAKSTETKAVVTSKPVPEDSYLGAEMAKSTETKAFNGTTLSAHWADTILSIRESS